MYQRRHETPKRGSRFSEHPRSIDAFRRLLESLEQGINKLTQKIAQEAGEEPRVRSPVGFPGIDYCGAMLLLAEMGDIKRFSSPKKLRFEA